MYLHPYRHSGLTELREIGEVHLYYITLETEEESIVLSFHGDALQDMDGDLSESDIETIKNVFNLASIFHFASEVITACKG